jgi:hypothetical protein
MYTRNRYHLLTVATSVALAACSAPAEDTAGTIAGQSACRLTHATFTTFDDTTGGCLQGSNPNGINCNIYDSKTNVFISGGPLAAAMPAGTYFFAVLVPGFQNGGFLTGADGNLSDINAGATSGDLGSGDDQGQRTFSIATDGAVIYSGSHAVGTHDGRSLLGLAPFDDTANPGGEYTVAVCPVGATTPCQCKYDNFKVRLGEGPAPALPIVNGRKYYDANLSGQLDPGETGVPGWRIGFEDGISGTIVTDGTGSFTQTMIADSFIFAEQLATNTVIRNGLTIPIWLQTGNTVNQSNVAGALASDKSYHLTLAAGDVVQGLYFGNVCLGAGGGLTLGFWSNKNGQALITAGDLSALVAMNLRAASGGNFDPSSGAALRTWLLNATATNMAYMLSAQLAAMAQNVARGFVSPSAMIFAPGTASASAVGLASISAIVAEANTELGAHGLTGAASPYRTYQEALKNALDLANNNVTFVQASAATCPAPTF